MTFKTTHWQWFLRWALPREKQQWKLFELCFKFNLNSFFLQNCWKVKTGTCCRFPSKRSLRLQSWPGWMFCPHLWPLCWMQPKISAPSCPSWFRVDCTFHRRPYTALSLHPTHRYASAGNVFFCVFLCAQHPRWSSNDCSMYDLMSRTQRGQRECLRKLHRATKCLLFSSGYSCCWGLLAAATLLLSGTSATCAVPGTLSTRCYEQK